MVDVHLDFETACDLDLRKVGLRRYVSHPSFRVLLTALAFREGPVLQWEGFPLCLTRWCEVPITLHAYNAGFERAVFSRYGAQIPLNRWRDTQAHAYARGFSGSLAHVGAQIGIPLDKAKLSDGNRLITKFCSPRRPSRSNPDLYWTPETAPDSWGRFCLYNRQDVEAERAVHRALSEYPWTKEEQRVWEWDQRINERGIPVDLDLVSKAIRVASQKTEDAAERCRRVTGGIGPGQVAELLTWAKAQGYPGDDLQAKTIENWLQEISDE